MQYLYGVIEQIGCALKRHIFIAALLLGICWHLMWLAAAFLFSHAERDRHSHCIVSGKVCNQPASELHAAVSADGICCHVEEHYSPDQKWHGIISANYFESGRKTDQGFFEPLFLTACRYSVKYHSYHEVRWESCIRGAETIFSEEG